MSFEDPLWLFLLLLSPLLFWIYKRRLKRLAISFPLKGKKLVKRSGFKHIFMHVYFISFCLIYVLLVVSLARPQKGNEQTIRKTEGLDIFLVIDTSKSMSNQDFEVGSSNVDRLTAVKAVVREFISKRKDDRIGLVVFGTMAFAQAPLTLDHQVLLKFLGDVKIGMAGPETAIGDAIGVTVNRLKSIKSKSKIAILLTDGSNTAGDIEPRIAAKAAKSLGIKFYTIGAGGEGGVTSFLGFNVKTRAAPIDEKTLKYLAEMTGGQYFRAKDTGDLVRIYETINKLEKTEAETQIFRNFEEKYADFLLPALFIFLSSILAEALSTGGFHEHGLRCV